MIGSCFGLTYTCSLFLLFISFIHFINCQPAPFQPLFNPHTPSSIIQQAGTWDLTLRSSMLLGCNITFSSNSSFYSTSSLPNLSLSLIMSLTAQASNTVAPTTLSIQPQSTRLYFSYLPYNNTDSTNNNTNTSTVSVIYITTVYYVFSFNPYLWASSLASVPIPFVTLINQGTPLSVTFSINTSQSPSVVIGISQGTITFNPPPFLNGQSDYNRPTLSTLQAKLRAPNGYGGYGSLLGLQSSTPSEIAKAVGLSTYQIHPDYLDVDFDAVAKVQYSVFVFQFYPGSDSMISLFVAYGRLISLIQNNRGIFSSNFDSVFAPLSMPPPTYFPSTSFNPCSDLNCGTTQNVFQQQPSSSSSISTGGIVGIVIGVFFGIIVIFSHCRRRHVYSNISCSSHGFCHGLFQCLKYALCGVCIFIFSTLCQPRFIRRREEEQAPIQLQVNSNPAPKNELYPVQSSDIYSSPQANQGEGIPSAPVTIGSNNDNKIEYGSGYNNNTMEQAPSQPALANQASLSIPPPAYGEDPYAPYIAPNKPVDMGVNTSINPTYVPPEGVTTVNNNPNTLYGMSSSANTVSGHFQYGDENTKPQNVNIVPYG